MNKQELINEVLTRSVSKIFPSRDVLERELKSGRKLSIYVGIDPTSNHLHLGHAASLWILRRFQDLGHKTFLLIGDFTARIGDPTDKLASRQPIKKEDVEKNIPPLIEQASRIISTSGRNPTQIRCNSKWYEEEKITAEKFIYGILGYFSFQNLFEREDFKKRWGEGKPLQLQEFIYPLLQGFDGVAMGGIKMKGNKGETIDIEIGGKDQIINMNIGRLLRKAYNKKEKEEKFFIATRLLVNPDTGKKLSKTEISLVNLDDEPNEMFGRVMAMPDGMILDVAELSTNMARERIAELASIKNPRDKKIMLAFEIVKTYHDSKAAEKAKKNWINTFSKKEVSEAELPELKLKTKKVSILDLVLAAGTVKSKNEAQRLINQGAVQINGETKKDMRETVELRGGETVKIGKKNFFRIKIS